MKKKLAIFGLVLFSTNSIYSNDRIQSTEKTFLEWLACVDVNTKFYSLSGETTESIATAVMGKCRIKQENFNTETEQYFLAQTSKSASARAYAREKARESTNEFSSQLKERIIQKLVEEKAIKGLGE
ncbi:hypothetical protein [Acinetobacter junii]|uniref:hypothetical protein n=1 Tax=Acinetobacter junii TaxID=40215 RepID=UPI001BAB93A2|nr:hypothetical protein [Acinetobacter junii]QUS48736.1 hypothetical protein J5N61_09285 [Acinetobacter junii]